MLKRQWYVPLFFIEGVINLFGFFLLAHVFGKALRKYVEFGDVGFGYIIWYGATRVVLEPLRSADYQMGEKGYWSWVWSMIFVLVGTALIVGNHIVRYILRKKDGTFKVKPYDKKLGIISTLIIVVASITLIVFGSSLMSKSSFEAVVAYNSFNEGVMLLVLGASIFLCLGISVPILFESLKGEQHE